MLKLPDSVYMNEKDNQILVKNISGRILQLLQEVLLDCDLDDIYEISEDNNEFMSCVSFFFPRTYPKEKWVSTFEGLYTLLEAEDEFVPELPMEYLMARLISAKVELYQDSGIPTGEEMEQHDYLLSRLHEIYDGNEEYYGMNAEEKMSQLEDWDEYLEICFWDMDYELLDVMTVEALRVSPLNEELGIGLKENDNVFVVPPEWLKKSGK